MRSPSPKFILGKLTLKNTPFPSPLPKKCFCIAKKNPFRVLDKSITLVVICISLITKHYTLYLYAIINYTFELHHYALPGSQVWTHSGACFIIDFSSLSPYTCLAQFSLSMVHKGGVFHFMTPWLICLPPDLHVFHYDTVTYMFPLWYCDLHVSIMILTCMFPLWYCHLHVSIMILWPACFHYDTDLPVSIMILWPTCFHYDTVTCMFLLWHCDLHVSIMILSPTCFHYDMWPTCFHYDTVTYMFPLWYCHLHVSIMICDLHVSIMTLWPTCLHYDSVTYMFPLWYLQEEQNASSSANYDVELLHSAEVHKEYSPTGRWIS